MIFEFGGVSGDEDGGSELSDVEDVFVGDEAELPKKVCYDVKPSKEEVGLHNITHLPYRSWCPPLRQRQSQKTSPQEEKEVTGQWSACDISR